ncbi:hypothetical protein PTKIN_Ptkin11bG0162500 [Pterospermum kingtungense]
MRLILDLSGSVLRFIWNERSTNWDRGYKWAVDQCDLYDQCVANAICSVNKTPICECLKGFRPESKWPDSNNRNLSKSAYASSKSDEQEKGCLMWYGDLIDMQELSEQMKGHDIYVRVPSSELGSVSASKEKKPATIIIVVPIISGMAVLSLVFYLILRKKWKRGQESCKDNVEVPFFDLPSIDAATNSFSQENLVGIGGFGPVYKGILPTGKEIAVKRLSKNSGQGAEEFRNEVALIAKLQHRNLVALFGCCIQGGERLLVYEYMPNKSLDYFVLDHDRRALLPWQKRFDIMVQIVRGLLYLHQDSKLHVIHRDIKASNILLDSNMNPKISDFGLARIFEGDDKVSETKRVVGTLEVSVIYNHKPLAL